LESAADDYFVKFSENGVLSILEVPYFDLRLELEKPQIISCSDNEFITEVVDDHTLTEEAIWKIEKGYEMPEFNYD
jgi:hypothetical protein